MAVQLEVREGHNNELERQLRGSFKQLITDIGGGGGDQVT